MSHALIWSSENWRLYGIDNRVGIPHRVIYFESDDLNTWSAPRYPNIDPYMSNGDHWWHIDGQRYNGEYIGLVHIIPSETIQKGNQNLLRSQDGMNWKRSDTPLNSRKESGSPNSYKSDLVPHGSGDDPSLELFCSGYREHRANWRINRTTAERISVE